MSWPPSEAAIQDNKFHFLDLEAGWPGQARSSPAMTSVPANLILTIVLGFYPKPDSTLLICGA